MGAILTDCVRETLAVRWFDTDRGFGFCTWEGDIPRDVFLHMNTLRTAGFSAPADGARVTGLIVNDHDRLRFATVEMVEVPPVSDREVLPKETLPADLAALPLEPARVKWFDTNLSLIHI